MQTMLEENNAALDADSEAVPGLGPARRKRSGTFHQASHRIRTRGAMDRCTARDLGFEVAILTDHEI